ncbi:MAG: hypothetical protein D6820_08355, partial [Lentisphaerae bacterium]
MTTFFPWRQCMNAFILSWCLLSAVCGWAQNEPLPLLPSSPEKGPNDVEQTIRQNLEDLKDPDPRIRHRALLILGKYHRLELLAPLTGALRDPEPRVREAALISLQEFPRWLDTRVIGSIIEVLTDSSVTNRRLASSMLSRCLRELNFISYMRLESDAIRSFWTAKRKAIIQRAVQDPDAIVRKNISANISNLIRLIPINTFLSLLKDPDADVRTITLS